MNVFDALLISKIRVRFNLLYYFGNMVLSSSFVFICIFFCSFALYHCRIFFVLCESLLKCLSWWCPFSSIPNSTFSYSLSGTNESFLITGVMQIANMQKNVRLYAAFEWQKRMNTRERKSNATFRNEDKAGRGRWKKRIDRKLILNFSRITNTHNHIKQLLILPHWALAQLPTICSERANRCHLKIISHFHGCLLNLCAFVYNFWQHHFFHRFPTHTLCCSTLFLRTLYHSLSLSHTHIHFVQLNEFKWLWHNKKVKII